MCDAYTCYYLQHMRNPDKGDCVTLSNYSNSLVTIIWLCQTFHHIVPMSEQFASQDLFAKYMDMYLTYKVSLILGILVIISSSFEVKCNL